jgi:hypothetical protein
MATRLARRLFLLVVPLCGGWSPSLGFAEDSPAPIDFGRDIRPILSDHCFTCHGPDASRREGGLRLDERESVFETRRGKAAVVPHKRQASELHARVTSSDATLRMPPPDEGRPLTERQIALLGEWIRQGAKWTDHWAFVAPVRPEPPTNDNDRWSRSAIDRFVLYRLRREKLDPSPQTDPRTLIRRVSLDLTGLPPTTAEVEAFAEDPSDAAYEALVDRLLQSPRYGEHMAVAWLDAARYADTSGYQNDGPRDMWRWRDWVIGAYNANMPFDRFTVEQLAGDLLEKPTLDQVIATGFNRNHRGNAEGGIIPEEYQVEYVVDRVDTTATVWLGLTMGCARCHDHKYDPIRQREFYEVFSLFNNVPESGRAIKEGNSPPYVQAPLPEQQARLYELDCAIRAAEKRVAELEPVLERSRHEWEMSFGHGAEVTPADWSVTDGLVVHLGFDGSLAESVKTTNAILEGLAPEYVPGPVGSAVRFVGDNPVRLGDVANFGYFDKFSMASWMRAVEATGTVVSRMTPVTEGAGWELHLAEGRLQLNLVKRWLDDAIRVESRDPITLGEWHHVAATYDGSRLASGIRLYVDGRPVPMTIHLDRLNQTFAVATEPLRVGGGERPFRGLIDEVQLFQRDLTPEEVRVLAAPESVSRILGLPAEKRSLGQREKLRAWHLAHRAPDDVRAAQKDLVRLQRERGSFSESLPTVMVMRDTPGLRNTHVLIRGQYDNPGEQVSPGVPAIFPPWPVEAPRNRLGFAQWLVAPDHPLTARVAVNRLWLRCFDQGLVRTAEDFGVQGDAPSHPELLDWLAVEFVQSGWDVKRLLKRIVTSSTYRQSSRASTDLAKRDPENRWLARGPRRRLPAETIRDQALFVGGLLKERVGGPSVKPYQPEGLWQEIATDTEYKQSHGDDLYRRSLYTYWKRTVAPPALVTLDATSREACTVQRSRTNTPLQALALMNDVTFVEAARHLAQRLLSDESASVSDRCHAAFRAATSRPPRDEELAILVRRYESNLAKYRTNPEAAAQLVRVGDSPVNEMLDPCELAALTTVTSLILNLDEVLTKE